MWRVLALLCVLHHATCEPLKFRPRTANTVVCPDHQGTCPGGTTCCVLKSGKYGCCPLPNAVCCEDGIHCCPTDYRCNKRTSSCEQVANLTHTNSYIPVFMPTHHEANRPTSGKGKVKPLMRKNVLCPGGKSVCEKGRTCCFKDKWTFNCCPFVNGICCNDREHCCPIGYTCDLNQGKCTKVGSVSLNWGETEPSRSTKHTDHDKPQHNQILPVGGASVVCPDTKSTCPDGSTCCLLATGQYGCCPLKQAVCCSDHLHCCPAGSTCDPQAETCKQGSVSIPWATKVPAIPHVDNVDNKCGDNKTTCEDKTTCCPMLDGYYACCPFENAKCCADKLHCCPADQECDIKRGECVTPGGASGVQPPVQPVEESTTSITRLSAPVVCPDGRSCPENNTCCQISVGLFGCCPLPQAVCCSDHTHCCPTGSTCDIKTETCNSPGLSRPWFTKTPAIEHSPSRVMCPDQASFCPDQTTCCLLATKQYGCCPLPQAECCSDGVHCCPSGYTCDTKKGSCQKSTLSIPWATKTPATPVSSQAGWVVCPDKVSQCADGQSCCMLPTGRYGCCPLPKAVCCSDNLHCCPEGTTCDITGGKCSSTSNSLEISWSLVDRPQAYTQVLQEVNDAKCNDGTTCEGDATCCKLSSGTFGCCPYNQGVCCGDQVHCCPHGFHCDATSQRCEKADSSLTLTSTLFVRSPATSKTPVSIVKCPGGKEKCPDGSSCCKQPSGQYGCCPYKDAVCCPDGVHCCPQGFACDTQSGTCTQSTLPFLAAQQPRETAQEPSETAMEPSKTAQDSLSAADALYANSVMCPDRQHECPDENTCCKLNTGEWGCCPMPQAVCCTDGEHCCPSGYLCQSGMCSKSGRFTSGQAFLSVALKRRNTGD